MVPYIECSEKIYLILNLSSFRLDNLSFLSARLRYLSIQEIRYQIVIYNMVYSSIDIYLSNPTMRLSFLHRQTDGLIIFTIRSVFIFDQANESEMTMVKTLYQKLSRLKVSTYSCQAHSYQWYGLSRILSLFVSREI